jgi:hypothetical protein
MSASPADTPLTTPPSAVATAVFEDVHVASVVTGRPELSDSVAVAVNCAVAPTAGAVPLTATAVTGAVDEDGAEDGDEDGAEGDDADEREDEDVDDGELVHAGVRARRTNTSRSEARNTRATA